jgi:hypothetical protein
VKVEEECLNVNLLLFLRSVQFLLHMCFDRRNVGLELKCRGQFKDIMKALGVSETVPVASGLLLLILLFSIVMFVLTLLAGRKSTHVIGSSKVETLFWRSLFLGNICLWESKILFHLCKLVKWII